MPSEFKRIEFRVLSKNYENLEKRINPHLFPSVPEYVKFTLFHEVSAYLELYRKLVEKAVDLSVGSVFSVSTFCPAPPVILLRWFYSQVESEQLSEFKILPKQGPETQYLRVEK